MKILIQILFSIVLCISVMAQVTITARPGEVYHLNEAGAIVIFKDGIIRVEHVMPAEKRPKAYRDIDLKTGDEILMINGKKVKIPGDIESVYMELEIGGEIKLGVRRDGELRIIDYKKADPETLPKRKMMKMKVEAGEDGPVRTLVDEDGKEHVVTGDSVEIKGEKISIKDIKGKDVKIKVKSDE